jgi:DUF1680 family protein
MQNNLQFPTNLSKPKLSNYSLFHTANLVSPNREEQNGNRDQNEKNAYFEDTSHKHPIHLSNTILPVYSLSNVSKGNVSLLFRNK